MTKKPFVTLFRVIPLLILLCLLLAGCGCKHEWNAATCTAPKTCSLCQATDGEATGHTWSDASCDTAKVCSVCNATQGEASGHTWVEATCQAPKTCSACKITEGEPADHTWVEATCQAPKTCSVCKLTEGEALPHTMSAPTVTKAATCLEKGVLTTVCTSCNNVRIDEEIPVQTTHTLQSAVTKAATCTQTGTKTLTCTVCNHTETETIPVTDHNYTGIACQQASDCTVCGVTRPLSDHAFYFTSDQGDRERHYASRREAKCKYCQLEKTEYYCHGQVYDLEAIKAEAIAYAKSLGFTITGHEEFKEMEKNNPSLTLASNAQGVSFAVWDQALVDGGSAYFIEQAKASIRKLYDICMYKDPSQTPSLYMVVSYEEGPSVKILYQGALHTGCGCFSLTAYSTG